MNIQVHLKKTYVYRMKFAEERPRPAEGVTLSGIHNGVNKTASGRDSGECS